MARRSSARLRDKASTPKRVSLSHDAPSTTRTPRTVPTKLSSVEEHENDEMPGAFPRSVSPSFMMMLNPTVPAGLQTATPTKATPIKPSEREMHPQLHHQSTAKPRDEARHLGFSNMASHTEPPRKSNMGALQGTPTRTRNVEAVVKSPSFQFTFRREHSLELSPEAKKLMYEKREEAAMIRDQMMADGEHTQSIDAVLAARKIAKPAGRYSSAHLKQFEKMDSIVNHASSFRAKPTAPPTGTPRKDQLATTASLKRSTSKAGLDQQSSAPLRPSSRDAAKPLPALPSSQLPRSTSVKDLETASPAKRVKRADKDDASTARPPLSHEAKDLPSTPQSVQQPSYPDLFHLTTPTQSSLARAASIKSTKTTKIPAPSCTPAKAPQPSAHKPNTQLEQSIASSALLARSPSKVSLFPRFNAEKHVEEPGQPASPLLKRSPTKVGYEHKAAVAKNTAPDAATTAEKTSKVPFLARSPSKLPVSNVVNEEPETPGKSASNKLFGRFNLLRQSPMKSILRSPQRLYSDDPAKVAAGTHMATPPKLIMEKNLPAPATAPAAKHVDFSSSTKARHEKAQSSTPSKTPSPSPQPERAVRMSAESKHVQYPDLTENAALLSPSPQKRRQTSGPQDFTFRAGDQGIVFGQSPIVKASAAHSKRPSTIRMVSADTKTSPITITGSKKRKFEFENKQAAAAEDVDMVSEKENTPVKGMREEEGRPAKRVKSTGQARPVTAPTAASAARRTTLGVKLKGAKTTASPVKRPSTISKARLAALAQPKNRG
ncbi:hypothetical protein DOTSEDRAFT_84459 [Dothistroma septosporum NZE10]|uniref:Erythromycin esterase n=1 Tax=Dothistroma septosporum (strain NZE10 / CBS 128990) TaxID=675120 RepID=N1Q3B6_DOTSN|nr:hypothetical protein DOTSEDRAFT_84459 [Dothistroma septosporum NZE10]